MNYNTVTCLVVVLCLPTPLTLVFWGSPIIPLFGLHQASSSITPAGSVHKSRGDRVVRMWVQLKRWCVSCVLVLQVMQNAALRTATGCTQDTNTQHLHDETLSLPIHEHLQLHASHYKQKTQHPSHPLHTNTQHTSTLQG